MGETNHFPFLAKRPSAVYGRCGRYAGPGGSPSGLRAQPLSGKFFGLVSRIGTYAVECVAMHMECVIAPHESWAEFAERLHATEHAGDATKPNGQCNEPSCR
ncbi:hypothetical protein GCM10010211_76280 [Streptomyces albospinus]|uniref:Uncharacterized protein n=1 Tax=Streptomyces albospinus TaxID=285515 RepID=A0ABQ2VQ43_9ACTN|nr:hypothetical protein [Streptomyces albospinus]GGU97717.1 hypothetical protein GCM10010211_76280 [Streptomyces albospinus]